MMKSKLFGLMSMAMGMIMGGIGKSPKKPVRPDGLYGAPPTNPKKIIPKGHQQFFIHGEEIWALNFKNAEKKYKKMFSENF